MGGQLIKGYSIQGEAIGSAGLMKTWKLFKSHKSGAQASASIFLIQKRHLKKSDKDQVIRVAKKESSSLLRVRHPGVLAVIEPLTEDQNILAFVTERVQGNLSQLIKQNRIQDFITSELQLKLFLYPFIETVGFIHDNLKQAHLALSFDNIYINSDGKWKIAGFGYNQTINGEDLVNIQQKIADFTFSAPEVALNKQFSKKSDIFSIGLIILNLLEVFYKSYKPTSIVDKNDYEKVMGYLKNPNNLPVVSKTKNPTELEQLLKNLLVWEPSQRYSLNQILQSGWINDSTLITVKYLDKISSYQNKQQLQFLKGLAGVLDDFQIRVIVKIIVPKLLDLLKFNHLIASIVYIVIDLLKKSKLTLEQFRKTVWPALKAVTQGKEITAQAIYLIVFNLQTLEKFVGEPDTTTHILPLYIKCFQCPQKLKHLALSMLQKLSKKIDYQFLKNKVLPKLTLLFKDPNIQIRKDALKALYSIINLVDSQTLSLVILPGLESARKMGSDPMINAIINKMYNMMTQSLSIEVISSKILPVLIPYLTEPSINKTQFSQFKMTIVRMIEKIEKEREKTFQNNPLSNENVNFDQADFRFKEEEHKLPEEKKGNYNFLANYREFAPQNSTQQSMNNEFQIPSTTNAAQVNQTPIYQQNLQSKTNQPFPSYNFQTNIPSNTNTFQTQQNTEGSGFGFNSSAYDNMGFNFSYQQKNNEAFDMGINKAQEKFSIPQGMNINKDLTKSDSQKQKKFVGPISSPKKQTNDISLDLNYFNTTTTSKPTTSNTYNLNLGQNSFNSAEIQIQAPKQIKPIAKPNFAGMNKKEPTFEFNNLTMGSNLSTGYGNLGNNFGSNIGGNLGGTNFGGFGSNLNSDDPFAQIEQEYNIKNSFPQMSLGLNPGVVQPPKIPTNNSYGLFESGFQESKPKNAGAPKNNFQLI